MKSNIRKKNEKKMLNNKDVKSYTVAYGDKRILYFIRPHFEKLYSINKRTLIRHRHKITETVPDSEHYLYFIKQKGMYCYSINMLNFSTYKKGIRPAQISPDRLMIDYSVSKMDSLDSALYNGLLSIPWNYIGGANTRCREIIKCVDNMKGLYCEIEKELPKSKITLYYTTELKEGRYHSHFSLSIAGEKTKCVIDRLKKCVKNVVRTKVPFVEEYDMTNTHLEYMSKDICQCPDGWGVITNSIQEYKRLASE